METSFRFNLYLRPSKSVILNGSNPPPVDRETFLENKQMEKEVTVKILSIRDRWLIPSSLKPPHWTKLRVEGS